MAELFHQQVVRLARARIGERVTLNDPRSPYHGQVGEIVDVIEDPDEMVVLLVRWPDGVEEHERPALLIADDDDVG